MLKRNLSIKRASRAETPPVNPMDSVGNMADAMLVLAVGIMLALVVNWNVDLSVVSASNKLDDSTKDAIPFEEKDLQQAGEDDQPNESDLTKMGTVYYDAETGNYYIIESEDAQG